MIHSQNYHISRLFRSVFRLALVAQPIPASSYSYIFDSFAKSPRFFSPFLHKQAFFEVISTVLNTPICWVNFGSSVKDLRTGRGSLNLEMVIDIHPIIRITLVYVIYDTNSTSNSRFLNISNSTPTHRQLTINIKFKSNTLLLHEH